MGGMTGTQRLIEEETMAALSETGKLKHDEYPGGVFASIIQEESFSWRTG
jgi:hypothetical protein